MHAGILVWRKFTQVSSQSLLDKTVRARTLFYKSSVANGSSFTFPMFSHVTRNMIFHIIPKDTQMWVNLFFFWSCKFGSTSNGLKQQFRKDQLSLFNSKTWNQFLVPDSLPAEQTIQRRVQPAAKRKARSVLCAQVYFTQTVLRMKTMITDQANPQHQHALQPHDRVRSFYVCVLWGWYSDR